MDNKTVGIIVIGIALLIGFITYSFNVALAEIVDSICVHGNTCPMVQTLEFQTNISIGIMIFVILIGLYLIFFADGNHPKTVQKNKESRHIGRLAGDERIVYDSIVASEGSILQSELVSKTGFNKVKITRILDKLEGKGIIERRRRGMTNIVLLKQ